MRDGEIEIRVRSPPKGFNYGAYQDSLEKSGERVRRERNESQEFEQTGSPAKVLKNEKNSAKKLHQREQSDPRAMRHEALRGDEAREALYPHREEDEHEEIDRTTNRNKVRSPQPNSDLALHYDRNYVPLSAQKKEPSRQADNNKREIKKNTNEPKPNSWKQRTVI